LSSEDHEIMQYTGLKDKNGKEIYEGDVVSAHGTLGVVTWVNELALWDLDVIINGEHGSMTVYSQQNANGYNIQREVIGNIYENPELLNK
jgi:uncharacterized phage protein (TIGR01671 family)